MELGERIIGFDIKKRRNNGKHACEGHKSTTKAPDSFSSTIFLIYISGNKIKEGKAWKSSSFHERVNASTAINPGSGNQEI